jgi:uncharacterized membrane protein YkvA (DUF1232 family)
MGKSFIDYIREEIKNIEDSGEEFDRSLIHFPDLVKLLCDVLEDETADRQSRIMINAALGYLLVPNDLLPEEAYGVYGYMDDMYLTCIVISYLKNKYPGVLRRLWSNDNDLDKVVDLCMYRSEKFLDEKNLKEKLLKFAGLGD